MSAELESMQDLEGGAGSEGSSPPTTPRSDKGLSVEETALAADADANGDATQQTQTHEQQQEEHGQAQQAEAPLDVQPPAEAHLATNYEVRIVHTQYPSQPHCLLVRTAHFASCFASPLDIQVARAVAARAVAAAIASAEAESTPAHLATNHEVRIVHTQYPSQPLCLLVLTSYLVSLRILSLVSLSCILFRFRILLCFTS